MVRARGPWNDEDSPRVRHVLDVHVQAAREPLEVGEVRLGGGEREFLSPRMRTPSSIDESAVVAPERVLRLPDAHLRVSRASTPARNRCASGPVKRYLYSGDVSKIPAPLRTAKYSNFSDIW